MSSNSFVLDLTKYRETRGANVPEGRYNVVVEDAQMGTTQAGDSKVTLWYKIIDGPQKDLTLTDTLTLKENTLFRIVGFMQSLGLPTPKKRLQINLAQFVGKYLAVDVNDREHNGKIYSNVTGYNRVERPAPAVEEVSEEVTFEVTTDETPSTPAEDPWTGEAVPAQSEPAPDPVAAEAATEPQTLSLDDIEI